MNIDCSHSKINNFFGKTIANHSIYLFPALPCSAITKRSNVRSCIKSIECGFIVVCGLYTKTVCHNGESFISENINFQVKIEDDNIIDLNKENYLIDSIEIKKLFSNFQCFNPKRKRYYKLKESDLILVKVSHYDCDSLSWTEDIQLL